MCPIKSGLDFALISLLQEVSKHTVKAANPNNNEVVIKHLNQCKKYFFLEYYVLTDRF